MRATTSTLLVPLDLEPAGTIGPKELFGQQTSRLIGTAALCAARRATTARVGPAGRTSGGATSKSASAPPTVVPAHRGRVAPRLKGWAGSWRCTRGQSMKP